MVFFRTYALTAYLKMWLLPEQFIYFSGMNVRSTTRPTTARCTLPQYMGFLIGEPKSATCTRLAEVTEFPHDSANRFLHRENYQPKDI